MYQLPGEKIEKFKSNLMLTTSYYYLYFCQ